MFTRDAERFDLPPDDWQITLINAVRALVALRAEIGTGGTVIEELEALRTEIDELRYTVLTTPRPKIVQRIDRIEDALHALLDGVYSPASAANAARLILTRTLR
jgi:hypothetical protein